MSTQKKRRAAAQPPYRVELLKKVDDLELTSENVMKLALNIDPSCLLGIIFAKSKESLIITINHVDIIKKQI